MKSESLKHRIDEYRRKKQKRSFSQEFTIFFADLYFPSLKTTKFLIFVFILILSFSHLPTLLPFRNSNLPFLSTIDKTSNFYQCLIAIHAAIGVIIFALIILIAESLRDKTTNQGRVLLKATFLYPLVVSEIIALMMFLFGDIFHLCIVPTIVIGLFTIWALSKVISLLLDKNKMFKEHTRLQADRVTRSIDYAINESIGNEILFQELSDKNIKLKFTYFLHDEQNYEVFYAPESGIITNIKLDELKLIGDTLEDMTNLNGNVCLEQDKKASRTELSNRSPSIDGYILGFYGSKVEKNKSALFCFSKEIIGHDQRAINKLNRHCLAAFVISREPVSNFREEVKHDISNIKDGFIAAIENNKLGEIDEYSQLYLSLANAVLDNISKTFRPFTYSEAVATRGQLFNEWKEINWLTQDISEIIDFALNSNHLINMSKVIYLPVAIARSALAYRDHFLFQNALPLVEKIYYNSKHAKNTKITDFLTDRSWRYLNELARYIEARIEYDKEYDLEDYAIHLFFIFNNLYKHAFDIRDYSGFVKFQKTILKLFSSFNPSHFDYIYEHKSSPQMETKSEFNNQDYVLHKRAKEIEERIYIHKYQLFYGLNSWIISKLINGGLKLSVEMTIKEFFNTSIKALPKDLNKITELFTSTLGPEVSDNWQWVRWEMMIKSEDDVHSIEFRGNLMNLYVIQALKILKTLNDNDIKNLTLHEDKDFARLIDNNYGFNPIVDSIEKNPTKWISVLTEADRVQIPRLKLLFSQTKRRFEEEILEQKREKPISQQKVQNFEEAVISEYKKTPKIQDILNNYDCYNNTGSINSKLTNRFGINQVADKEAFLDDPEIMIFGLGQFGRSIANGENKFILDKIVKRCEKIDITQLNNIVHSPNVSKDYIIISTNHAQSRFFDQNSGFIPKWRDEKPLDKDFAFKPDCYSGRYNLTPVFDLFSELGKDYIIVLNRLKLCKLIQYSPLNSGENPDLIKDIFYMNVRSFTEDHNLISELLNDPPEWLLEIGSRQEQIEHLKERVLIKIFQKIEIEFNDDFEGYVIDL